MNKKIQFNNNGCAIISSDLITGKVLNSFDEYNSFLKTSNQNTESIFMDSENVYLIEENKKCPENE